MSKNKEDEVLFNETFAVSVNTSWAIYGFYFIKSLSCQGYLIIALQLKTNLRSPVMVYSVYFSTNEYADLTIFPLFLGSQKIRYQQGQTWITKI